MNREPSDPDFYAFVRNSRIPRWQFDTESRSDRISMIIAVLAFAGLAALLIALHEGLFT